MASAAVVFHLQTTVFVARPLGFEPAIGGLEVPKSRSGHSSLLHVSPAKSLFFRSGAEGIRTPDLRRAKAALSQLSYGPGTKLSVRPAPPLFNAPAKSRNGGLAGGRIRLVSVRLAEED